MTDLAKPPTRPAAIFRALRHRNYRLFISGQLVSLCGTWMQSVAQSWLVYRLTGSAALLGLVAFTGQFPVFLFATIGGTLGDRYDRRRIIIVTQSSAMALAFVLAGLTLSGQIRVWHVFLLSSLLGIVNAIDIPVRQAFIVDMVGRDDIINAVALNSSVVNGARMIGPAIAGALVASVGEGWCFFINAVSYLAVITGLLLIVYRADERAPLAGSAISNVVDGFRYIHRTRPVRALLLLLGLVSLAGMPYSVLMPVFAGQILHGGAGALGVLMGAAGAGALIGALTLAARRGVRGLGQWIAFATAGFGASLILFASSRSFPLSVALLVPAGFCLMVELAASNTVIQTIVPDELRGRIMAVYSMMFLGMTPFGAIVSGTLAERIGAPWTVALGGTVCVAGAIVFAAWLPAMREEVREIIVALEMTGGEPAEGVTGAGSVVAPRE